MKNIYMIGIGLIGGSFAIDIKKHVPEVIIYGIDTNENHLNEAKELGILMKKQRLRT